MPCNTAAAVSRSLGSCPLRQLCARRDRAVGKGCPCHRGGVLPEGSILPPGKGRPLASLPQRPSLLHPEHFCRHFLPTLQVLPRFRSALPTAPRPPPIPLLNLSDQNPPLGFRSLFTHPPLTPYTNASSLQGTSSLQGASPKCVMLPAMWWGCLDSGPLRLLESPPVFLPRQAGLVPEMFSVSLP